ncbi:UPF0702 transmembrane protein YetF [Niallia sp. NCCP-28]|nr:DUF421 domain-containing protein [Niallia sp. NCCP-28]GKU81831.1 UPF0702 transmembrane protein YetF [Niallia sp. NCCP-28]
MIGFIALLFLTKVLGKTEITQITTFDFVSVLVLGELVGNALYDDKIGIPEILSAVGVWGFLIYLTELLTQKFRSSRSLLEGKPAIIINKGKIDYNEVKKNRLDLNQLQHLLRAKDIFSFSECYYAILETDGTISAMKKQMFSTPTKQDLNLPLQHTALPISVIMDGEIIQENLPFAQYDKDKLSQELKRLGIASHKEVLYAEWQENMPLYIQKYEENT